MAQISDVAADSVEWHITAYTNVVKELGLTARLSNDSLSVAEKQEIIDEKVAAYNCIRGKLIGTDGIALIDGTDYSEREYFRLAMQGETVMSEPLIAKTDGSLSLIAAAPVWEGGRSGTKVVGVVFLSLQPSLLNDIVKSINVSANAGAYIINSAGTTVAHTTEDMVASANNTIENAKSDSSLSDIAALEQKMIAGESGIGRYTYKGVTKILSYAPIDNTNGWSIGINAPTSDFVGDTIMGILITIALVIGCILVSSMIAIRVGRQIGEPIHQCAKRLSLLMEGDLQSEVPKIDSLDEIGVLAKSTEGIAFSLRTIIGDISYLLSSMATGNFAITSKAREQYIGDYSAILTALRDIKDKLSDSLGAIKDASVQVNAGAGQLSESAQSLAEGSTDQAGAVEELTATIENVTGISWESAENAKSAYQKVDQAVLKAQGGGQAMSDLTSAMQRINETSMEIQNIITAIEDIASQTNLLSLNASIEAARAGEAGRGFAVVAEQIGKLAADSAKSAVDTRDLIDRVLQEISGGSKLTDTTSQVFHTIVSNMEEFSGLARGSAEASIQQAEMLEQVQKGIEQISSVVQNNSALSEETSATSEELSAQAETMNHLVDNFKF